MVFCQTKHIIQNAQMLISQNNSQKTRLVTSCVSIWFKLITERRSIHSRKVNKKHIRADKQLLKKKPKKQSGHKSMILNIFHISKSTRDMQTRAIPGTKQGNKPYKSKDLRSN